MGEDVASFFDTEDDVDSTMESMGISRRAESIPSSCSTSPAAVLGTGGTAMGGGSHLDGPDNRCLLYPETGPIGSIGSIGSIGGIVPGALGLEGLALVGEVSIESRATLDELKEQLLAWDPLLDCCLMGGGG